MPVLSNSTPGKAHQAHEPSKSHREDKKSVLGTFWHLTPADFPSRFGPTHHQHINHNDKDDRGNHCKHLINTKSDAHNRGDEVPIHSVEKDHSGSNNEKSSLDCSAPFLPGHNRLLIGSTVE